jgi:hypothetical protein
MSAPIYNSGNITVVADGLYTSILTSDFFFDLIGQPSQSSVQVPELGLVDYPRYQVAVQVEMRRLVAVDKNLRTTEKTALPDLITKYLDRAREVKVEAIGLNFQYQLKTNKPVSELLLARYFAAERIEREFGNDINLAGLKLATKKDDYTFQTTIDPVWDKPFESVVSFNYHFRRPFSGSVQSVIGRFRQFSCEIPPVLSELINAAQS